MDLSFTFFDRASEPCTSPADLAMSMVGVAARQAASVTACMQTELERQATEVASTPFRPADGRFSAPTARAMAAWKDG